MQIVKSMFRGNEGENFRLEPDYLVGVTSDYYFRREDVAAILRGKKNKMSCVCRNCKGENVYEVLSTGDGVGCTTFDPENLAIIKAWALEDRTGGGGQ